jgi:type VI secretion system secreted protein VgrG
MNLIQDAATLLAGLAGDPQGQRLLRLSFPRGDGPASTMLANALCADEAMSCDFNFEAEVLSDDVRIPLKAVMGKMVTISLVRNDGSLRYFNGYVFDFRFVKTDAGFAFYNMTLKPWLAFLRLRQDSRVFQSLNMMELCDKTFENYLQRDYQCATVGAMPDTTLMVQFNESDHNHLHRRLEQAGMHYWYEHREDGHTLWLGDDTVQCQPVDGGGAMRYQNAAGAQEDDGIHQWSPVRHISPGKVTVSSYDFKPARAARTDRLSLNQQGAVQPYEVYESTGAYGFKNDDAGEALANSRMDAIDARGQDFAVSGNDRVAQPGRTFRITDHFSGEYRCSDPDADPGKDVAGREYLILSVRHTASNNYQNGRRAPSHYSNSFSCLRKSTRWRPRLGYSSSATRIYGVQTATVVGYQGDEISTDKYGRVRVQFHWDRVGKFDAASSPLVRVMTGAAGANFGLIAVPRVGQEVVVMFLDGNCDRPMIIGSVYNGANMPPWELPAQRALAGKRSRELGGQRGNHLVLDDTTGKIQAQLKSDHLCSQLSLGHISRIDGTPGRQDARGEGFELRSDGRGALRSGKGMLISTEARTAAAGGITAVDETVSRLEAAGNQHAQYAEFAQQVEAQQSGADQSEVAKALQEQHTAIKGNGKLGELDEPHLLLSSPAGIESTTPGSTHLASGEHIALTAGSHVSLSVGKRLLASVRDGISLLAHQMGLKLIANAGVIDIKALTDTINVIAKLDIQIASTTEKIRIYSPKTVEIGAGDSFTVWKPGSIVDYTQNRITNADFAAPGPKLMPGKVPPLPQGKICSECMKNSAKTAGALGKVESPSEG